MATLGNQTLSGSSYFFRGINVENASWSSYTMPSPGGTITAVSAYFDLDTGSTATCYVCVWSASGTLLGDAAITGVGVGSQSPGGQHWHSGTLASGIWIPGGTSFVCGFWVPQANGFIATVGTTGTSYVGTQSGSGPGTASGPSSGYAELGAYVTYTPLPAPTISGISPNPAPPGSNITITGTSFTHATGVTIGGVSASYTVNSDTQITATIPAGVTGSGITVSVTNPAGTGSSSSLTVGQIWTNPSSGVASLKNIYTNPAGTGVALIKGVFTNPGSGVKQIW